jgi:shikimate 5-dehydrogenase
VVDGLSMLLHRTVRQIELLTGATGVPVALLREAARAELLGRAARETEPAASGRKLL